MSVKVMLQSGDVVNYGQASSLSDLMYALEHPEAHRISFVDGKPLVERRPLKRRKRRQKQK